jgi:competence protein ComEA
MPEISMPRTRLLPPPRRVTSAQAILKILMLASSMIAVAHPVAAQSINDQPPARIVAAPVPKVDINRASIAQLMRVPGITHSYAQRIVAGRPYANKAQLETQSILPPQVYEAAKDRLIAHHIR